MFHLKVKDQTLSQIISNFEQVLILYEGNKCYNLFNFIRHSFLGVGWINID